MGTMKARRRWARCWPRIHRPVEVVAFGKFDLAVDLLDRLPAIAMLPDRARGRCT